MENQDLPSPFHWSSLPSTLPPRWGHTLSLLQKQLILFGGYSSQYLSDLWALDLESLQWHNYQLMNSPESRSHHTAISLNPLSEKILIFGGKGKNNRILTDLYELDWNLKKWRKLETKGQCLNGRYAHSADLIMKDWMVIFGGENIIDLDDLWVFDINSHYWNKCGFINKGPQARKFHGSTVIGESKMVIIGGCFNNYVCLKYY